MCGIAGIIQKKNIGTDRVNEFVTSCKLMHHRGPDYFGVETYENVTLIHLRLSIIDLDKRSHQPFSSNSGNLLCTYNGELYNYPELKRTIKHNWKTTSDTEVLIEHFEIFNTESVKEWNGIFAVGIIEKKQNTLHLIKDRLGVKPLYIYENEEVILFSSEAKVILDWIPTFGLDFEALHQYIWYGNTTGEKTVINGLYKVKPASIVSIDLHSFQKKTKIYWDYNSVKPNLLDEEDSIMALKSKLKDGIKRQMISDVPIGILLSGGIDSSGLVAFAALSSDSKIDTYSIEYDYNIGNKSELEKASLVAKRYETNHHELKLTTNDVKFILQDLVFQYDEPFADPAAVPLYQLAKACSADKRVILQGDGGDELFGGYNRYSVVNSYFFWRNASRFYKLMPTGNGKERFKRLNFILSQKSDADMIAYYLTPDTPYKNPLSLFSEELLNQLMVTNWNSDYNRVVSNLNGKTKLEKLLLADFDLLLTYRFLEKVDKATMLCSVESRVPYLDNEIVDFALSLSTRLKVHGSTKKYILKKALKDVVPSEILNGRKRGFDVPYRKWLRDDLYEFAMDTIKSIDNRIINHKALEDFFLAHRQRKTDYGDLLWKMLVLSVWLNIYKNKIVL